MKRFNSLVILAFFIGSNPIINAQSDDQLKLENLRYYLTSLKDNVLSMRYYTDSVNIINMLDQIEILAANIESEVDKIVIPESEVPQTNIETTETVEFSNVEQPTTDESYPDITSQNGENDQGGLGISKYMPFKKKFNTNLKIEFGINSLINNIDEVAGVKYPEINTAGSWYWDFGLVRNARLGGKDSKIAFNYGISFLKNRIKLENDVLLTTNAVGNPQFIEIDNVKENPKLNVGYLNIPLGFTFSLSKKTKLELGGYAGYRIHTVQKNHLKVGKENIHEQRYARHELNNWVYGAKASLNIAGFNLIGRYNFSKLFNDNPNYDFNTYMFGTSFSLF